MQGHRVPKLIVPGPQDRGVGSRHTGGNVVASPEPAVGVFTPAGTCPGRLRRHFVIGCARPWTEPVCRQVRRQSGSGRV